MTTTTKPITFNLIRELYEQTRPASWISWHGMTVLEQNSYEQFVAGITAEMVPASELARLAERFDALRADAVFILKAAQEHILLTDNGRAAIKRIRETPPASVPTPQTFIQDKGPINEVAAPTEVKDQACTYEGIECPTGAELRARATQAEARVAELEAEAKETEAVVEGMSLRSINAAADAYSLRKQLKAAQLERTDLRDALNIDRTGLAATLNHVKGIVGGYSWIRDGHWGSYDYTQQTVDTLRAEVGHLIDGVLSAADRGLKASGKRATDALRATESNEAKADEGKLPDGMCAKCGTYPCSCSVDWAGNDHEPTALAQPDAKPPCKHQSLTSGFDRGYSPVTCVDCGAECNCGRARTSVHDAGCPIASRAAKPIQTSPIPEVAQRSEGANDCPGCSEGGSCSYESCSKCCHCSRELEPLTHPAPPAEKHHGVDLKTFLVAEALRDEDARPEVDHSRVGRNSWVLGTCKGCGGTNAALFDGPYCCTPCRKQHEELVQAEVDHLKFERDFDWSAAVRSNYDEAREAVELCQQENIPHHVTISRLVDAVGKLLIAQNFANGLAESRPTVAQEVARITRGALNLGKSRLSTLEIRDSLCLLAEAAEREGGR